MITSAQITAPPISGLFNELVYDAQGSTENWTWVKLETNRFETSYGQFKGSPIQVALSELNPYFYVLTKSFLYEINREDPSQFIALDYYDLAGSITNLTITSLGELLLSSDYVLFKMPAPFNLITGDFIDSFIEIENPIHVDNIQFKNWHNDQLQIEADYLATNKSVNLYFEATKNQVYK